MIDAAAAMTTSREPHPAPSLRVLLYSIVDYAGLFPPASLDMNAATREYAQHRAGTDAWALGRFVLPAARLEEFEVAAKEILPRDAASSWALSALLGSDLEEDLGRIERFNGRHGDARRGAVLVDTVELKTHSARDVMRASDLLDRRFDTYMEVPVHEDPAEMIAAITQTVAKAKIRTGGVTPDAFPTSAQVLRFIQRCIAHDVAFKATAGLHHPWRAEYPLTYAQDAPRGTMFGFLNVLLCTAALLGGLKEDMALAVLEERDARAVAFDAEGARWRGQRFDTELLERARECMAAFGSCSFREPMDDLRGVQLL
jgi:hypothetical protein